MLICRTRGGVGRGLGGIPRVGKKLRSRRRAGRSVVTSDAGAQVAHDMVAICPPGMGTTDNGPAGQGAGFSSTHGAGASGKGPRTANFDAQ